LELKRESKLLQPDAMEVPAVSSRTVWRAADKEGWQALLSRGTRKDFWECEVVLPLASSDSPLSYR